MTDYERMFESALAAEPVRLSPQGHLRRQAIGAALGAELRRRRRGRRRARAGMLLAAAVLLGLLFWPRTPGLPGAVSPEPTVRIVRDDPTALQRYRVTSRPIPRERLLDDDGLLGALARAGHPSGILRAGRRVVLTAPLDPAGGEE